MDLTTSSLTQDDDIPFTFTSIDLADPFNDVRQAGEFDVKFDFTFDDATTSTQTVTVDDQPGLQTFAFNFANLVKVDWSVVGVGRVQFDNIVVSPVPVPGALLLFSSALLGIAGMRRRVIRRQTFAESTGQ